MCILCVSSQEEPFGICGGWCCGLSKEHLEAFIYWAIMCWASSRRKSGRADISYRKYRPLRGDAAVLEEEAAAEAKHAQQEMDRAGDKDPAWLAARREAEAQRAAAAAAAQGSQHGTDAQAMKSVRGAAHDKKLAQQKKPLRRKNQQTAVAAKASQELSRSRHILHQHEADSNSSGSSTDEEEHLMQSAPADQGVDKGTWLAPTRWGFGR